MRSATYAPAGRGALPSTAVATRTKSGRRAAPLKTVVTELSRRGPHRVLRGDLALAGLPGIVMTPESGISLPAVAFGHGWLQAASRYSGTLTHLASWGIVAAAPATQRGPVPSHTDLAADLRATLDVCTGVRLGPGRISVDPGRLGLAGHSMGAGAAVLATAADPRVRAFVGFATALTSPSAVVAAGRCTVPGLFLNAETGSVTPAEAHAEPIARAWAGPAVTRVIDDAVDVGLVEGRHWGDLLVAGGSERKTQKLFRALATAFLLHHLTGDDYYAEAASAHAALKAAPVAEPPESDDSDTRPR